MRLFTPGPVAVHADVLAASAAPPLYHRSAAFRDMAQVVWQQLTAVYRTEAPVAVLAGSGMTGIEAAMASTIAPDDAVVVVEHGRFGERLATIASRYGGNVTTVSVPWGECPTSAQLDEVLHAMPCVDHVWMVHSETSTGVTLDLQAMAQCVRSVWPDALLGVDAITSLAIHPLLMDAWDADLVVSASQKGLGCPPGLATLGVSARALGVMRSKPATTYTLHVPTVLDSMSKGLFPWTPPVTLLAGLNVALSMILSEGIDNVWQRHADLAAYTHKALRDRGFTLFGDATSHAVTVIADVRAQQIQRLLLERHGMVIAGGQDKLQGQVFRVGTCGWLHRSDMDDLMDAIDDCMPYVTL